MAVSVLFLLLALVVAVNSSGAPPQCDPIRHTPPYYDTMNTAYSYTAFADNNYPIYPPPVYEPSIAPSYEPLPPVMPPMAVCEPQIPVMPQYDIPTYDPCHTGTRSYYDGFYPGHSPYGAAAAAPASYVNRYGPFVGSYF